MANPKETIILYDGKQIASFLAGQTATLTTKGDEVEHNIVVQAGNAEKVVSTHALYSGVKLPKIPEDVLAQYPYAWIRKHTTNGQYQLVLAGYPWYYNENGMYCSGGDTVPEQWYNIPISTADTALLWTFNKTTTGFFTVDADRPVLWSNHDIPNGSATATDIYFEGTEPVPIEETETISIVITYDGNEIASLKAGQTATVKCANTEADFDIVVSAKAEEVEDELAGTWQLNDTVSAVNSTSYYWKLAATMQADGYSVTIPYSAGNYTYDEMSITFYVMNWLPRFKFATYSGGSYVNGQRFLYYGEDHTSKDVSAAGWYYEDNGTYTPCSAPIIKITSKLAEVENGDTLLAYLQANATKQ